VGVWSSPINGADAAGIGDEVQNGVAVLLGFSLMLIFWTLAKIEHS
jgi:hypothetical protein